MTEDIELLRRYAENHSEDAFTELVHMHVNFVYATALRVVGNDAHHAADVSQRVFTDLAHKAASLTSVKVLTAWLYTSTRYTAANVVRAERRRQARENEAQTVYEQPKALLSNDRESLRIIIDEALSQLSSYDREAIILRFIEEREYADIGAKLSITADASRLRVQRALEKIRIVLRRRGVTSTAVALTGTLTSGKAIAAPAGLALSISATALAGETASSLGPIILTLMNMTKLKTGLAAALLLTGATIVGLQRSTISDLQKEMAEVRGQNERYSANSAGSDQLVKARLAADKELQDLRGEVIRLKSLNLADRTAGEKKARKHPFLAGGLKPAGDFVNAGNAKPSSALETLYWAGLGGDVETFAKTIQLSADVRKQAEVTFATLPEATRAKFRTPDRMVATILSQLDVEGMQVLKSRSGAAAPGFDPALANDPAYNTLTVQIQHKAGDVRQQDWVFQQTAGGWQWSVPASVVQKETKIAMNDSVPLSANGRH